MFRPEIITTTKRFAALASNWDCLWQAAQGGPFSQHDWILSWIETRSEPIDLQIVVVWQGDLLVAALPLAVRRRRLSQRMTLRVPMLTMAHGDDVGFHDVLMRPGADAAMDPLVQCLTASKHSLSDLTPLRNGPGAQALVAALKRAGHWHFEREEVRSAIATLNGDLQDWLARRKSKRRQEIRRNLRKAETSDLSVHIARTADDAGRAVLDQALTVSQRSWKETHGTSIASTAEQRAFYKLLFDRLAPKGRMCTMVLCKDGQPLASSQALVVQGGYFGIATDYDLSQASASVGRMMCELNFQEAAQNGATHFDMLRRTDFTTSYADTLQVHIRLRFALRPTVFRGLIQAEAAARAWAHRFGWRRPKRSGRRTARVAP